MSLTSHIANPNSAFMRFAKSEIPNSKSITKDRRGGHYGTIGVTSNEAKDGQHDWALIGTAIDFRLRLAFSEIEPMPASARRGYRWLSRQNLAGSTSLLHELEEEFQRLVSKFPDPTHPIELQDPEDEQRVLRLCVVAAWLDQLHRAGPFILDRSPLIDTAKSIRSLDEVAASVSDFVLAELSDQVALANIGLSSLRSPAPKAVVPDPRLNGADRIGGADADLVVDGTLIDFKSTRRATTIGRADVYQLAGYVLFDFDDDYKISGVGTYWTRHGLLRTFTVDEYFTLLGATQPIEELRKTLQTSLGEGKPRLAPEDRQAWIESMRPLAEDYKRRQARRH